MTYLHIKAGLLQVSDQRQAAADGVRLALPQHLLSRLMQPLEPLGVQVAGYALREGGRGGGVGGWEGGKERTGAREEEYLSGAWPHNEMDVSCTW